MLFGTMAGIGWMLVETDWLCYFARSSTTHKLYIRKMAGMPLPAHLVYISCQLAASSNFLQGSTGIGMRLDFLFLCFARGQDCWFKPHE